MKIYVVSGIEAFGEDRSTEYGVMQAFRTKEDAINYAREIFNQTKITSAKMMKKYANAHYDAGTFVEEFEDSFTLGFGRGDDFYFFNIWVEESELK